MSSIPREAAEGFQRGALDYERGRPGYPEAAIALLARELGIGPEAVVDEQPRTELLDEVSRLVQDRGLIAADGMIDTPYRTHVVWCRALETLAP
jgi:hypothetical protein